MPDSCNKVLMPISQCSAGPLVLTSGDLISFPAGMLKLPITTLLSNRARETSKTWGKVVVALKKKLQTLNENAWYRRKEQIFRPFLLFDI